MWLPFSLLSLLLGRFVNSTVTGDFLDSAVLLAEDVHLEYDIVSFEGGFGCDCVIECIHEFIRGVEDASVIVVGQVDHEDAVRVLDLGCLD